jgi:LPS-assembly protein
MRIAPPLRTALPRKFRPDRLVLAMAACMGLSQQGLAQPVQDGLPSGNEPSWQISPMLDPTIRSGIDAKEPVFLSGDRVKGRTGMDAAIEGNAQLRKRSIVIKADRLEYRQADDIAKAAGNVRILRDGNLFTGTELELKLEAFQGHFLEPQYEFLRIGGAGRAERIDFIDDKRSVARNATFSTCRNPGLPGWLPDWILQASKIDFDFEEEVGRAENAQIRFKDIPLLAAPSVTFPLTDKRKSGLLPPSINIDNISGLELSLPYYWNLAPNRDLTLSPTLKTKRGIDFGAEFRYLEHAYQGLVNANFLPADKLRDRDRWGLHASHQAIHPVYGLGAVGINMNLNRVSDDNYWRDFPRGGASLTQRLLPNDLQINWQAEGVRAQLRTLKWQTLQDTSAPILAPYDKLPNLNVRMDRPINGLQLSLEGDYAHFVGDPALTGQPNAHRSYAIAAASFPIRTAGMYIVPKVQLHQTQYRFDSPVTQVGSYLGATSANRSVPTYSIDAGLIFERNSQWFGRDFIQTLEPRLFWTKTPFRDQLGLPVYDSAARDFNFTSIWNENEYSGQDRISASNTLTVGAVSKLLNPESGVENLRLTLAQRLRFADQNVVLPGEAPATAKVSDLLFGVGLNWNPQWQLDSTVQYSPTDNRSVRATVLARYSPSHYRVVSVAYRFKKGSSEQIDIGWQWPLDDLWRNKTDEINGAGRGLGSGRLYSVGRINYSMQDKKVVDAVLGIEYDSGCWLTRVVLERLQRSDASPNTRIMFQLEFSGFSRVGSNPTETLKQQIPGYQFLREKTLPSPNRFTTYE